jgi:hypothetical protein
MLVAAPTPADGPENDAEPRGIVHDTGEAAGLPWAGGPVELDKVVPPSGNMWLVGKQSWLGSVRAGQVVRFWAMWT